MNFTDSPFEQMMKEAPPSGQGQLRPLRGVPLCQRVQKSERTLPEKVPCLLVEPQASGPTCPEVLMAGS